MYKKPLKFLPHTRSNKIQVHVNLIANILIRFNVRIASILKSRNKNNKQKINRFCVEVNYSIK